MGPDAGDMLRHVDWDRTKAYALGLAGIYVNQQDREARDEQEDRLRAHAEASQSGRTTTGSCPAPTEIW